MNKFAQWMIDNDKKQRGTAERIGISTSSLHDILKKDQMPSLKVAYEIENYTKGAITVYDWVDQKTQDKIVPKTKTKATPKKIKK